MTCDECSRRALLRGLVVGAAGAVLASCGGGGSSSADARADDSGVDAGPPLASMCGGNVCIDLASPPAAPLATVGGTVTLTIPGDTIIVVRTSQTAYVVLSDICTHRGCAVSYNASAMQMTCPCHGSRFSLTGAVTRGPASVPLAHYATMLDDAAHVLTVVLA